MQTWIIGSLALGLIGTGAWNAAAAPSETLLPAATRGFVSVTNTKALVEHWNKTQLGRLVNDPVMKPFVTDLRRQLDERWSGSREKLGLTIDDLRDVASGEVAFALVQPAPDKAAVLLIADVSGRSKEAQVLVDKIETVLVKQKAVKSETQVAGATLRVFTFPKPTDAEPDHPAPQAFFCLKDGLLLVSDRADLIAGALKRAGGAKGDSLADDKAFAAVMKRCKNDAGEQTPQLRWFIQPFGYAEAIRAARPERLRRKGRTFLDGLKAQGFTAVQGAGGYLDFAVDKQEMVHRTAIYAPQPHEKAMQMLRFPNRADFTPQPWVPSEVSSYCTLYCDIDNAFKNFGSLFDEFSGDGKPGLWNEMLLGLKREPPHLDVAEELIAKLGQRVTIISDYQLPITTTSERLLIAIEAKDEKTLLKGIGKFFDNDDAVRLREFEGHKIWEAVPPEKAAVPAVSLELPGLSKDDAVVKPAHNNNQQGLMPNYAVTVAKGHLFIASHYEYLTKILSSKNEKPLPRSVDYQLVTKSLAAYGAESKMLINFAKTDEQYRPTYELIRQGKMPESETLLGRILNTMMGAGKKGVLRKQEIDGSKMPDFEFVRRNLGPAGLQIVSEKDGWFIKGGMLPKGG